mgnify:CR=1 FL=1
MTNFFKKTSATIISAAVLFAGVQFTASAAPVKSTTTQTVTISAKRMSTEQKVAYDQAQANSSMQTVVISAKRLAK